MGAAGNDDERRIVAAIEIAPADRFLYALLADCLAEQGLDDLAMAARWVTKCQPLSNRLDYEWGYFWLNPTTVIAQDLNRPPPIIAAYMKEEDWYFFKKFNKCIAAVGRALLMAIDEYRAAPSAYRKRVE